MDVLNYNYDRDKSLIDIFGDNFNNKINWYFIRLIGLINNLSVKIKRKKLFSKKYLFHSKE